MSLSIMSLKLATTKHMMLSPAWSLASLVSMPLPTSCLVKWAWSWVKVFRLLLLISISIVLQGFSSTLNLNE